ncbi:MAG TPA: hypothetical protein VGR26_02855 [Acidimicrobiales bacterium]|nr:hypothetical protein [Acidimicrobiales bacterium]HEV2068715.1 hypothetical protein [Acidimicrobiales bacterium]
MRYLTPELRNFGTFAGLTKGVGGSCPDGGGRNNTQLGGGSIEGETSVECGPGTGGSD